jgi:hypothetical protein
MNEPTPPLAAVGENVSTVSGPASPARRTNRR